MQSYARAIAAQNARLRDLCEKEGILYIPVAENLTGGTEYFTDNCHLWLHGIERKADIAFRYLKDFIAPKIAARTKS